MKSSIFRILTFFLLLTVSVNLYAAYPFVDDFESGTGSWTSDGGWGTTTVKYFSPTHALTDSPNFFYTNNTDSAIQLAVPVDLTSASLPALQFYHRYSIENGYDNGVVEVSTDDGVTWEVPELVSYTGNSTEWSREQLDLSAYLGESIIVRFRIVTDGSVIRDGWYIDDVLIDEAPAAPENLSAQSTTPNEVNLTWNLSASANVTSYRIYRGESGAVDWHDARLVVELPETSTNYTDIAVTPKTTYAYRVMAVASSEMHGISEEAVAVTTAGLDFPFMDDAESATTIWNADSPWDISDDDSFSPSHSWSDSPYANYENSINASLRVATPLDLTAAADPVLCFIHKYNLISGDSAVVEVSVNANDWTALEQFTGKSDDDWLRQRYDLSAYTNSTTVYLRFRLTTDTSAVTNGWNVDDISVAESPDSIPAPVLDQIQSHSIRLTWQGNSDELFSHYAIYRSTATGVGINDTLVANVSNQTSTVFTDTFLALDTEYYYRVYAVSTYGAFSADGTESHAHTLNNPLPFSDGFEGTLIQWNLTGNWGVQTSNPYSGTSCLSDSPDTEYLPNVDSTAETAVDLSSATWPVLKFWDRVELNTGDWIKVEISPNGTTWYPCYSSLQD
nr:immune inhibitor A [Kiritimatiellia bacterium]